MNITITVRLDATPELLAVMRAIAGAVLLPVGHVSPAAAPPAPDVAPVADVAPPDAADPAPKQGAWRALNFAPVWTDERRKLGRSLYEAGFAPAEMLKRLNALPGRPIASVNSMTLRATQFGWRRPWMMEEAA